MRSRDEIDPSLFECAIVDARAYWPELSLSMVFASGVGLYVLPDEDGRDFWDVLMPDETMIKVVAPRTWIRKPVDSEPEAGREGILDNPRGPFREIAVEVGLNEAGLFAMGAAAVARLDDSATD